MQLAEAYMRVHLWPRSADEYAQALTEDVHLAEPILTQLRNHGALDPHPMKYPLQVVALRAVAESSREADWQWALSAMTWLTPRWSAEELYDIGRRLHQKVGNVELEKSQIVDLLLNMHQLALRAGDAGSALDYLAEAWDQREHSDQDLTTILRSFDTSKLPEEPALWVKFRLMELQVALTKGEQPAILEIARQMAGLGQAGRIEAQKVLAKYEATLEDPVLVRVERLKLLDLDDAADQNEFVEGLLSVGKAELPTGVARELARMALKLATAAPGAEERQRLLLMMLRKLGDYARAWQLALWHVGDAGQMGKDALSLMEDAASSEFAVSQQVDLVEAYLRRGETERAGAALERLQWANLGETPSGEPLPESLGQRAADLAEALLTMVAADDPAAHASRRWLVNWYRERGHTAMAADHLLWAHVSGLHLPAAWMHDSESADLLYRSGLLYEAAGTSDLALKQYKRARLAKGSDEMVPALVRLRLSALAEEKGEIHEAYELAQEALDLDPSGVLAKKRVDSLKRHIFQHQVEMARNQPDSAQRSLAIARLQRSAGELSEAISELQAAIGRGQNDAEVYVELAECFVENGEFNIARRAYNEVLKRLEVENREPELRLRALYGLATAEEELDKPDQAILLLEQILVIRHNYRDSRQRLDRLYAGESSFGPGMGPDRAARAKAESDTGDILDELLALLRDPGDNPSAGGKR
jgi:tetratricopeptide (TPR) repeat protein